MLVIGWEKLALVISSPEVRSSRERVPRLLPNSKQRPWLVQASAERSSRTSCFSQTHVPVRVSQIASEPREDTAARRVLSGDHASAEMAPANWRGRARVEEERMVFMGEILLSCIEQHGGNRWTEPADSRRIRKHRER